MPLEMLERALPALAELSRPPAPSRPPSSRHGAARTARRNRAPGSGHDPAAGRAVDWRLIAGELGTRLPGDYVELVHRYQGLVIDDRLGIRMPRPGWERWYVDGMRDCLQELEVCWTTGDSGGHLPYPRPRGLMPWGGSIDGDTFYWRTHPDGPEAWTVVVCGADNGWEEVERDLTGYLAGLVLGELEPCGALSPDFPGSAPSVTVDDGRRHPTWD
ncbi:hypothetical protein [Streptomyces sulfonofaciens]|nr:hypothetical protein [Streptomyces sulfonofaciens]